MNSRAHWVSASAAMLAVAACVPAAAQSGGTCRFTMRMDMPAFARATGPAAGPKSVQIAGAAWQSGRRARIEMSVEGQQPRTVILSREAVYSLQPGRAVAVKRPMTPQVEQTMFGGFPLLFLEPVDPARRWPGARKTGTAMVSGKACDIWQVELAGRGGQEASVWIPRSPAHAPPVKAVISMPTPQFSGGKLTSTGPKVQCTVAAYDVRLGQPVPASRFAVPRGYVVRGAPPAPRPAPRTAAAAVPARPGAAAASPGGR